MALLGQDEFSKTNAKRRLKIETRPTEIRPLEICLTLNFATLKLFSLRQIDLSGPREALLSREELNYAVLVLHLEEVRRRLANSCEPERQLGRPIISVVIFMIIRRITCKLAALFLGFEFKIIFLNGNLADITGEYSLASRDNVTVVQATVAELRKAN